MHKVRIILDMYGYRVQVSVSVCSLKSALIIELGTYLCSLDDVSLGFSPTKSLWSLHSSKARADAPSGAFHILSIFVSQSTSLLAPLRSHNPIGLKPEYSSSVQQADSLKPVSGSAALVQRRVRKRYVCLNNFNLTCRRPKWVDPEVCYLVCSDPFRNSDFPHKFYRLCRLSEDQPNLQHLHPPLLVSPPFKKLPRHQLRSTFLDRHKTPRLRREPEPNVPHLGQCQWSKHTSLR